MNRIAVFTDAHGNLPAVKAALETIQDLGCDAIYHTGDAVGIGPFPAEVMDSLLGTSDVNFLMGNHDAYCCELMPSAEASGMSSEEVAHQAWVRQAVGLAHPEVIKKWPWELVVKINGLRVAFVHYPLDETGRSFNLPLGREPAAEDLDKAFERYDVGLVFYGHVHAPSDVQGRSRYVNTGSLGCSHDAASRFVTVDVEADGTWDLRYHAVAYDEKPLLRAFEQRSVPARDFILPTFFGR